MTVTLRRLGLGLSLLLLLSLAPGARAGNIYYVSRGESSTPLGDNARSCFTAQTSTTPKLTIGGASGGWLCATGADDIVDVRAGTYPERPLTYSGPAPVSGTAGHPKTLRGHVGETVMVKPSGGCSVFDFATALNISWWVLDRINVDGSQLSCGTQGVYAISMNASSNLVLSNLSVLNTSNNGGQGTAIGIGGGNNVTLLNVTVDGTHKNFGDFQASHCVYMMTKDANNVVIDGGTYKNCGGFGIQFNDGALTAGSGTGGIIRNATVTGNGRRSSGSRGGIVLNSNQQGGKVYNNLVYNNVGGEGIAVWGSVNTNNEVYNNTVVGNGACINIGTTASAAGAIVKNNLCKNNGSGITVGTKATNTVLGPNLIHGGGTYTNSGTNTTAGTILTTDPKFVNISANNFHLTTGSGAIDTGTNLSGTFTTDFDGTTRTAPWELGAYVFGTVLNPLHLAFLTVPATVVQGTVFTVVVQILDASNVPNTAFSNTVTLAKASGPGVLGGTLTCTPSGGLCTWANLTLDTVGVVTLSASTTGATGATSSSLSVMDVVIPPVAARTRRTLRVR